MRGVGDGPEASEAMSDRGALGRRMPFSTGIKGGDCELGSRGIGKVDVAGELKEEGGFDDPE